MVSDFVAGLVREAQDIRPRFYVASENKESRWNNSFGQDFY